jgi:hypothetical protein
MFTLDLVSPWGRSFEDFRRMFALSDADLRLRILGCADGPASFNVEFTESIMKTARARMTTRKGWAVPLLVAFLSTAKLSHGQ